MVGGGGIRSCLVSNICLLRTRCERVGMCRFSTRFMLIVCKAPHTPMVVIMRVLTFYPRAMGCFYKGLICILLFYMDGEVRCGY